MKHKAYPHNPSFEARVERAKREAVPVIDVRPSVRHRLENLRRDSVSVESSLETLTLWFSGIKARLFFMSAIVAVLFAGIQIAGHFFPSDKSDASGDVVTNFIEEGDWTNLL